MCAETQVIAQDETRLQRERTTRIAANLKRKQNEELAHATMQKKKKEMLEMAAVTRANVEAGERTAALQRAARVQV